MEGGQGPCNSWLGCEMKSLSWGMRREWCSADTEHQTRVALIGMPNLQTNNGYIYAIANQDLTKIGITTDLKRRMKELSPDKIHVTAWIPRYEELERKLHAKYRRERIPQTEYFRLSEEQINDLIAEIQNIEETEMKRTREHANTQKESGTEQTDMEFMLSIPAFLTDHEVSKVARKRAHADYLSSLSWRQRTFGDHGERSKNFEAWYKEHSHLYETEKLYKELYKNNEDLNVRVMNIMARKEREAKRQRRRSY